MPKVLSRYSGLTAGSLRTRVRRMAAPRKKRSKERDDLAEAVPPKLTIPADFPEDEVHERPRATVRGLFRRDSRTGW